MLSPFCTFLTAFSKFSAVVLNKQGDNMKSDYLKYEVTCCCKSGDTDSMEPVTKDQLLLLSKVWLQHLLSVLVILMQTIV